MELGAQVHFRHPLVRSALYARPDRGWRAVHGALPRRPSRTPIPTGAPGIARTCDRWLGRGGRRGCWIVRPGAPRSRGGSPRGRLFWSAREFTPDPGGRAYAARRRGRESQRVGGRRAIWSPCRRGPLDELGHARGAADARPDHVRATRGRDAPALLLARPRGWSRSTPTLRGRRTWRRSRRRLLQSAGTGRRRGGSRRRSSPAPLGASTRPASCCWAASRALDRGATRPGLRALVERCRLAHRALRGAGAELVVGRVNIARALWDDATWPDSPPASGPSRAARER